jgi:hypothetical protein
MFLRSTCLRSFIDDLLKILVINPPMLIFKEKDIDNIYLTPFVFSP